ncbi:hypothetical protein [Mycobacterium uberis]|uniref:hypothetical protein n=1 Tax=Mycobacterium uberis TaxID=2162698 RepID=UPI000E30A272|nr:hypothetical protein [Mycobacterium uberis]
MLDAAVDNIDVTVGVVSKIDVHRTRHEVVTAHHNALPTHEPRCCQVSWVGAAALPDVGEPQVDDSVDSSSLSRILARRNRLRSWALGFKCWWGKRDRDAEDAGERVRVDALRA